MRLATLVVVAVALAACSKKSNDKQQPAAPAKGSDVSAKAGSAEGSAGSAAGSAVAAGSGAGSAAPAGPVRSLTGDLEVSGSLSGTYHWNKKGELSCGPGGVHIDFTTGKDHETGGAGGLMGALDDNPNNDDAVDENAHDLMFEIDNMAPARLTIVTLDLPAPMKTSKGFKMTVGEDRHIQVTVDTTLTDIIVDPDAPKPKKTKKKVKKPAGPKVTIKGTLEIDCPPLPK